MNAYPTISFRKESKNNTSINLEECKRSIRCNESLKEFLAPMMLKKEASSMKKC